MPFGVMFWPGNLARMVPEKVGPRSGSAARASTVKINNSETALMKRPTCPRFSLSQVVFAAEQTPFLHLGVGDFFSQGAVGSSGDLLDEGQDRWSGGFVGPAEG